MRLRTFVVGVTSFLMILVCLQAADTLPSSISDTEFRRIISEFSEAGGSFDFEMFMSNEVTFQKILPDLLRRVPAGGVYLGVAPEQNFTYITALRPRMAFIIDIRRQNMLEMLMYKALFELSPTRKEFLSRLFSRRIPASIDPQTSVSRLFSSMPPRGDSQYFAQNVNSVKARLAAHGFTLSAQDTRTVEYVYNAFYRGGPEASLTTYGTSYRLLMLENDGRGVNRNFLASEANYQFVRQMQQKNMVIPVVGDFAGPKAMRAVAGYLKEHNAEVSAFYVSNVEEYIQSPRSVWAAYCRNLSTLPLSSTSMFIRFGRGGRGSFLSSMPSFVRSCA